MEHKSLDKMRDAAEILPNWLNPRPLTKRERLELWAQALEREGDRQLNTLFEVEYEPAARRALARADDSLLTVAFSDPRLRAEGLAGDTMGDALAFFRISERQLHEAVCFCHHGPTISATRAAVNVRALAARPTADIRPMIVGGVVAASLILGVLLV
jgi:hypothetical protein